MNILITGANGFIGRALVQKLSTIGFNPYILSTSISNANKNIYKWDPGTDYCETLPDINFYGIINLAGKSITNTRWNEKGKREILASRVHSTLYLKKIVANLKTPPKHFISISGIGYYGLKDQDIKSETSPPGNDFAAKVCVEWENAASALKTPETQLSILRTAIVLGKQGGLYKAIKKLAFWKIAAPIGTGNQPVNWIHIIDIVEIFVGLLEGKIPSGTYNAVADFNSNREITHKIAKSNSQPFIWPPVPAFILKLMYGEMAGILISGTRVSNSKLKSQGFEFRFTDLDSAISDISSSKS